MRKGIILSAGNLPESLTSEIGFVPPVFLPFGGTFLLHEQVKYLDLDEIYLTLPIDFIPNSYQSKTLLDLQINVMNTDPNENVKVAFAKILDRIDYERDDELHILMGDTLFTNFPEFLPSEFFSINFKNNDYNFMKFEDSSYVFTGYIKLSGERLKPDVKKIFDLIIDTGSAPKLSAAFIDPWFDLGHFNDFFQSKVKIIKARHFNRLSIDNYCTIKKSSNKEKIKNEIAWYKNLPITLAPYASQLYSSNISQNIGSYTIKTNHGHLLSDLLVYYDPSVFNWKLIYDQVCGYLNELDKLKISSTKDDERVFNTFFVEKTHRRIAEYQLNHDVKVDLPITINSRTYPSIFGMVEDVEQKTDFLSEGSKRQIKYLHGDLCFSNIFFDFRAQRIALIDPRGYNPDLADTNGPFLYELVKLAHSAIYHYDYIIQGWFEIEVDDNNSYKFSLYAPENKEQIANFNALVEKI